MSTSTDRRRTRRRAVMAVVCALGLTILWSARAARPDHGGVPVASSSSGRAALRVAPTVGASSSATARDSRRVALAASGPERIAVASQPDASAQVWPARNAEGAASLNVFLHGMCSQPEPSCAFWSDAGREGSFLVCPAGNGRCGDRPDWRGSGAEKASYLDRVVGAVRARYGDAIAASGDDVLIGFSRGAFVARDVIYERPGIFRGVVLIGAHLDPDPARFLAAGVRRVVMAAGEYDGARPAMQRAAVRMTGAGLPARYVSLGHIGHQLPADLARILAKEIRWVRGNDRGPEKTSSL